MLLSEAAATLQHEETQPPEKTDEGTAFRSRASCSICRDPPIAGANQAGNQEAQEAAPTAPMKGSGAVSLKDRMRVDATRIGRYQSPPCYAEEYRTQRVNFADAEQRSEAYSKINPMSRVLLRLKKSPKARSSL